MTIMMTCVSDYLGDDLIEHTGTSAEWSEESKRSLIGMGEFEKLLTGQVIHAGGKQK